MKHTEKRWMHIESGEFAARGISPSEYCIAEYELVTVTWDVPEWEEVEVKADPQSPNSVWYRDECGVTRQVPRDAEIIAVFRRRKPEPEPEPEVWVTEVVSRYGLVHLEKEIPREWIGKRVRVEVIEP